MTRQREAAKFKAPVTEERERREALAQTPNLPGMEVEAEKRLKPKSDDVWRLVEKMCEEFVQNAGYIMRRQVPCGKAFGSKIVVDIVCSLPGVAEEIIVSIKWQREQGSFDEKIPAEVEKLHKLLPRGNIVRAYVLLAGPGFRRAKRERWCEGEIDTARVRVVDLDFFIAAAGCRKL